MKLSSGYSLIEILVVLLIISIVAGVTVLKLNPNKEKQMDVVAGELVQKLTLVQEEAMLESRSIRLTTNGQVLQFFSNGDLTPFSIDLGKAGPKPHFIVTGEADGHISYQKI